MAIALDQVTNSTQTGVLDVLMAKVQQELDVQFQHKRITGPQFAEICLNILPSIVGQSIQYVTAVETANNQAMLINAQRLQVEAETLKAQVEKQILDSKLLLAAKELEQAQKQIDLLDAQLLRADIEKALIQAKVDTEKAQIVDIVNGLQVAGIVGKQKDLYAAQKEGFARDAEQKALKLMTDAWSIEKSTDPDAVDRNTNGLHDSNIKAVVEKAMAGIGVVPQPL